MIDGRAVCVNIIGRPFSPCVYLRGFDSSNIAGVEQDWKAERKHNTVVASMECV